MDKTRYSSLGLADVLDTVLSGGRLSAADGERLFACPDVLAVGALADFRRRQLHGDKAFFVRNRHVNYTNICANACTFCAYHRAPGQAGGYVLEPGEVARSLAESPSPPREVHIVGGCHPDLRLSYYEELLFAVRRVLPGAALKCFTAVEIAHFAAVEGVSTREVLIRLAAAGLDMLPGGGAEIFAEHVRRRICPNKISAEQWLAVHAEAHELGLPTNCTMLFGHVETAADRIDHLIRLRDLQDRTRGFVCCIPLPFLVENSRLAVPGAATGVEELKTIAISRLLLDNIPHLKAYWVMLSEKQAQAALHFGADDFDGTVVEERIGHTAGATSELSHSRREIEEMIRGSGFVPVERDALFREIGGAA
jgi:aminodeoxyfutalosine synthase